MTLLSALRTGVSHAARLSAGLVLGVGLSVGITPGLASAQEAEVVQESPAASTEQSRPALWVVRDADSTVYLFGTVHLMRPGNDWMTPAITDAFNASEELWLEIVDPTDQTAAAPLIMQHGLSPQTPLSSLLSADEQVAFDEAAAAMGATRQMLDPMRPWLAAITLSMAPLIEAGFDPEAGVDVMLRERALEIGKPIQGLETLEQQLMFFANMTPEQELDFLRSTLETYEESATMLDAMSAAWSEGSPALLFDLGGDEMKADYPEIYDLILTRRNADWGDQIQEEMAGEGTIFIAVGALHLAGPDSVQAMLEAEGVTVERVQ